MLRAPASRLTSLAFIVYLSGLASPALGQTVDITCEALEDNSIDWDCIFGPDSLEEVYDHGGELEACPTATERHPCSMFTVEKEEERAEVKVQEGPEGFMFLKGEHYVFRYSFRAKEGMAVGSDHTHFGQLKGAHNTDGGTRGGNMLSGDPIYGLVANNEGLMVRFSNKDTIEDYHRGLEVPLNWEAATGQWVHVKIDTTFGEHMEVELSGAVEGKAVWPENLPPIAWHNDAEKVRMKLGLYHEEDKVADGEVEYRSISIEGPNGVIRTREPTGSILRGCYQDGADRVLQRAKYVNGRMSAELCESLCEGSQYFGMQYGYECWCGGPTSNLVKHGTSDTCNVKCPGNSRQTCGGSWAISIYEYEGSPKVIPLESDYVGCFADFQTDRALTIKSTSTDQMSPQRCNRFCSWSNAKYYGVQYGRECFCGYETDRYDKHGPGICYMPCVGIPRLVCGGFNAMNVYRVE